MRKIFTLKVVGQFQQGTIINNCVLDGYEGHEVFGIIITPRCDIENSKVATVHYLPLVSFKDWFAVDFWNSFIEMALKDTISRILKSFTNLQLSPSLYEYQDIASIAAKLREEKKKEKDILALEKLYAIRNILLNPILTNEVKQKLLKDFQPIVTSKLKELKENKLKEYYLIENWENPDDYYVIYLREVKRITFPMIQKISTGIFENDIQELDWIKNDLKRTNDPEGFLFPLARMNSPFIEHLIQSFITNFGRIGIDDLERGLEETLFSKYLTIFPI